MNLPPLPEPRVLRVVLADDNPVVRLGLASLLESTGEVLVAAEASNGREAVEAVLRERPDVALLDIRMPLVDGVTATAALAGTCPVLVLTHSEEPEIIRGAVEAGACGYLVHGAFSAEELLRAVRGTAAGESHLSPVAATAMLEAMRSALAAPARPVAHPDDVHARGTDGSEGLHRTARFGLSDREAEVMEQIVRGLSNADIASALFLSEKTVKNHVNRIFAKLHASSRAAAIAAWLGTSDAEQARR